MSRINILFVHASNPLDHLGGGETTLISLAKNLDKRRFRAIVAISGAGPFQERLREAGVDDRVAPMDPLYYKLAEVGWSERALRAAGVVPAVRALARIIRVEGIDLVCTNVQAAHIYGALAARVTRRPVVMYMRDIPNGRFSSHFFPWLAAGLADHVVAISSAVRDFYCRAPGLGARLASRTSVVSNGIELERFSPMAPWAPLVGELGLHDAAPVVTLVGRLQPLKGQDVLIRAAPDILGRFPEARFLLIGEAFAYERGYGEELRALARAQGVEHAVVFAGQRSDVREILSVTDILVSASEREAFGRTLVEAMAMGKPVVATRSGGPTDIVLGGRTGVLVEPGDSEELASAVVRLWSDPSAAKTMGMRGRARALECFDVAAMVQHASSVFEQVLTRHGRLVRRR